jgi:hypothetical protein
LSATKLFAINTSFIIAASRELGMVLQAETPTRLSCVLLTQSLISKAASR